MGVILGFAIFYWTGEVGAAGPAFPGPLYGLGGGLGEGRATYKKALAIPQRITAFVGPGS